MASVPASGSAANFFRGIAVRLLLVCATMMELRACLACLPASCDSEQALAGTAESVPDSGVPPCLTFPACELEILLCGVGPVAAALSLGRRLGRDEGVYGKPSLRGILNFGLAGTYDAQRAPLGSLVLATEERYPEYGIWPHPEDGGAPAPLGFPQATLPQGTIFTRLDLAPDRSLGNLGLNWHSCLQRGPSVTVAGVSGSVRRARQMASMDTGSEGLTENMEGFSLALGAAQASIPFLEIRAVSNLAGLRPPEGWDVPVALASLGNGLKTLLTPYLTNTARPAVPLL